MNKKNKLLNLSLFIFFFCFNIVNNIELNSENIENQTQPKLPSFFLEKKSSEVKSSPDQEIKQKIEQDSSDITKKLKEANKDKDKKKITKKTKPKITNQKKFQLNFENAALKNVIEYISELFNVTFFQDDAVGEEKKQKAGVGEVKVTFKPNKYFTKKQVWNFFDLILEIAGFARISMPGQPDNFYRITQIAVANKSNLPTYVGTDINQLPDYQRIRYIYFVQNRQASHIKELIAKIQSKNAQTEIFQDLNVLIMTDSAYNIKTLMQLVQELDSAGLPEILSIIKLKNADASDVAKLYESLKGKEDIFRPFSEPKRAMPRLTESTKVIVEPRTNSLIIFGPKESVLKFENFVKTHIDKELEEQPSKVHVFDLNYAPAEQIANILNSVTQFGAESEAAKAGGIRQGEKYLSRMFFEPEKQGNRLIIRGEPEDYEIVKKIIRDLDVQQPQVAIEVFILSITFNKLKAWNSQIRNNPCGDANFQTSGFNNSQIQINSNTGSICTNLINLALSAIPGSTVLTLGKQNVWGIFSILEKTTDAKIIANPFLVATNKYTASVSLGQTRRVKTGTIFPGATTGSQDEFGTDQANLTVSITPQINDFGIVSLEIDVIVDNFIGTPTETVNTGLKDTKKIKTFANVADQEVLALGGLIRDTVNVLETGLPILSKIPLIGFLFKNKSNNITKENLLIFMSPKIIRPHKALVSPYTLNKAERVRATMNHLDDRSNLRDPIHRWFFNEPMDWDNKIVNKFLLPKEEKVGVEISKKIIKEKDQDDNDEAIEETDIKEIKESKDSDEVKTEIKETKIETKVSDGVREEIPQIKRRSLVNYIKQ